MNLHINVVKDLHVKNRKFLRKLYIKFPRLKLGKSNIFKGYFKYFLSIKDWIDNRYNFHGLPEKNL